jgi:hypothetical protein
VALADERGQGVRQGDGFRQVTLRRAQRGKRLGLDRRALGLTAPHQPRRPAGRARRLPGCTARQPGLAHPARGITGDGWIPASGAPLAERRPQLAGVTAARLPDTPVEAFLEHAAPLRPGEVRHHAARVPVETSGRKPADRTMAQGLG